MSEVYVAYPSRVNAAYLLNFLQAHTCHVGNVSKHSQDEKAAIGERLASARKLKGITQLEAAAKLEITKAALSAWETGRNLPDALMLRRLAKTYGTSSDALLWDDSLTPESMKFAAEYDALSDANRRKFIAMWKAYYAEAATDELVSQTIKAAPRGKVQHRDSEKL